MRNATYLKVDMLPIKIEYIFTKFLRFMLYFEPKTVFWFIKEE